METGEGGFRGGEAGSERVSAKRGGGLNIFFFEAEMPTKKVENLHYIETEELGP